MRSVPLKIMIFAAAFATGLARAESWPETENECTNGDCINRPSLVTAKKTFLDLKKKYNLHPEDHPGLIVAASARTGLILYGMGKHREYLNEMKAAARMAWREELEIKRVTHAIAKALEPELERHGKKILETSTSRVAVGTAEFGTLEAKLTIEALKDPATKARILATLEKSLGPLAPQIYEKIVGPFAWSNLKPIFAEYLKQKSYTDQLRNVSSSFSATIEKGLGKIMASSLAKPFGLQFGKLSLGATLMAVRPATGLAARCLGGIKTMGSGILKTMTLSNNANFALMVLSANPAGEGSDTRGAYTQHPERLWNLPTEDAIRILEEYPEVRGAIFQLRDLDDEISKQPGGEMVSTETNDDILQCDPLPSTQLEHTASNPNFSNCSEMVN